MHLILIRRDDPEQIVTLVRWQNRPQGRGGFAGWWGQTATMIGNHRTPCMFPESVWRVQGKAVNQTAQEIRPAESASR